MVVLPKLQFFFVIMLFFHLLHLPVSLQHSLPTATGFKEQEIERSKIVAVNRRGGGGGGHSVGHGGGGHGVGGGEGGHGGHNGGDRTPVGGGAVIPLYAAGGASGSMHRNDNQHHGSRNAAISLCIHLWWLTAAASLVFMFM